MNKAKDNDFLVAAINNPTFDLADFKNVGLNSANTGLKSREEYKGSEFIREKFTDSSGKFNDVEFNKFYDSHAKAYDTFTKGEFEDSLLGDVEYDPFNQLRPTDSKVAEPVFAIDKVLNPDRLKTGVSQINRTDDREWGIAELAQKEKIFDYTKNEFRDYTPNDHALTNSKFGLNWLKDAFDPMVLATWDEDGTHFDEYSGQEIKHKKGEYKLNDKGTYYYETLGGRDIYNKEVKSIFDTLTVDNEGINKYDFFDSDGIDKSVTGTVFKSVAALSPLLLSIPFPALGVVYGAGLVGTELLKAAPMLYNWSFGMFDETPNKTANTLAAFGTGLRNHTSEYAKTKMITVEGMAELITDVALQWSQQKAIAQGVNKLLGTKKLQSEAIKKSAKEFADESKAMIEKAIASNNPEVIIKTKDIIGTGNWTESILGKNIIKKNFDLIEGTIKSKGRLAADVSLGYMSLISNTDTYNDMLNAGTTRKEAAAVAWGATIGMFGANKLLGLGDLFLDDLQDDSMLAMRAGLKNEVGKVREAILSYAKNPDIPAQNKIQGLFKKGLELGRSAGSKFYQGLQDHTLGLGAKMLGEGLEEVSEELITDFTKQTFEFASALGYTPTRDAKVGAFENMLARYGMSFFGGAVGGGIFGGIEAIKHPSKNKALNEELIYLLRNGQKDKVLEELHKMHNAGKLGDVNRSARRKEKLADGTEVYASFEGEDMDINQNDAIYDIVKDAIISLDQVIHEQGTAISDDRLLDKMILSDLRFEKLKDRSYQNRYLQDFQELTAQLTNSAIAIQNYVSIDPQTNVAYTDAERTANEKSPMFQKGLEELQTKQAELYAERDKFLNGEKSLHYVEMLLFGINDAINRPFYNANFNQFIEFKTGKEGKELSEAQLTALKADYEVYKSQQANDLKVGFDLFQTYNEKFSHELEAKNPERQQFYKLRKMFWEEIVDIEATNADLNPDEFLRSKRNLAPTVKDNYKYHTLADYQKGENESEAEFAVRATTSISEHNQQVMNNISVLIDRIINEVGFIDGETKQLILNSLGDITSIKRDIVDNIQNIDPEIFDFVKEELLKKVDDNKSAERLEAKTTAMADELHKKLLAEAISDLGNLDPMDAWDFDYSFSPTFVKLGLGSIDLASVGLSDQDLFDFFDSQDNTKIIEALKPVLAKAVDKYKADLLNNGKVALAAGKTAFITTPEIMAAMYLENLLSTLEVNPIYQSLQQFSVSSTGKRSRVLDIIAEEERKMDAIDDLADFFVDTESIQDLENAQKLIELHIALVAAAMETETSLTNLTGYNTVINDFIKNHPEETKGANPLGIIDQATGQMMVRDLLLLSQKINYLINLSLTNSVNKFQEHKNTGYNMNKIKYEFLTSPTIASIKLDNVGLLDGIDALKIEDLKKQKTGDIGYLELNALEDLIYDNLRKMAAESGLTITQVIQKLNINSAFNQDDLIMGRTSILNSKTKDFTDFEKLSYLFTIFATKGSQFNTVLKQYLGNPDNMYAPLPIQEYAQRVIVATHTAKDIMSQLFYGLPVTDSTLASTITVIVDGAGGSGKTTAIAKGSIDMLKSIDDKTTIVKIAPKQTQLDGLNKSIGADGEGLLIEDFMKFILGDNLYKSVAEEVDKQPADPKTGRWEGNDFIINEATYNTAKPTSLIVIDEYTHINTVYMQHIQAYAKATGATLILLGDPNQNGYVNKRIFNLGIEGVCIRTPKVHTSMRDSNIQKQENLRQIMTVMDIIDEKSKDFDSGDIEDIAKTKYEEFFTVFSDQLLFSLKYYDDDVLNGDAVIDKMTEEKFEKLGDEIGYVYDNENSETYKFLKAKKDAGHNITFYKPEEIQGSEKAFMVIDIDFTQQVKDISNAPNNVMKMHNLNLLMRNIYTMLSRSKEGTYVINNGLDTSAFKINSKHEDRKARVPSLSEAIKEFKAGRLEVLNKIPDNPFKAGQLVTPNVPPTPVVPGPVVPTPTPVVPTPVAPTPTPVVPTPVTPTPEPGTGVEPTVEPEVVPTPTTVLVMPDKVTVEPEVPVTQEEEVSIEEDAKIQRKDVESFENIRVYGEYNVVGLESDEDGYMLTDKKEDCAVFLGTEDINSETGVNYLPESVTAAKDTLLRFKATILAGRKVKDNTELMSIINRINPEYKNVDWDNGQFVIVVEPNKDVEMFGNSWDSPKGIEGVTFKVVYKVQHDGQEYTVTMGAMADPATWINYVTSSLNGLGEKYAKHPDKEAMMASESVRLSEQLKAAEQYKKFVDQQISLIKEGKQTKQYVLPKESVRVNGLTYLGFGKEKTTLDKFREENPHLVISRPYIYTGKSDEKLTPGIKSSVKGRTVVFMSADPSLKAEELAEEYRKQKALADEESPRFSLEGNNPFTSAVPGRVRMVIMDEGGTTFKEFMEGVHDNTEETMKDPEVKNALPFNATRASIKMFVSMWNYRVGLIEFNNFLEEWERKNGSITTQDQIDKFNNEWQTKSTKNGFINEFRLLKDDSKSTYATTGYLRESYPNGEPIKNPRKGAQNSLLVGTYMRKDFAKAQLTLLDGIFNTLTTPKEYILNGEKVMSTPLLNLESSGLHRSRAISAEIKEGDTDGFFARISKAFMDSEHKLEIVSRRTPEIGMEEEVTTPVNLPAKGGAAVQAFWKILSGYYKIFNHKKGDYVTYSLNMIGSDGSKTRVLLGLDADQINRDLNTEENRGTSVLNTTMSLILHGTANINDAKNPEILHRTYSPFPKGMLNYSKIKYSKETKFGEFMAVDSPIEPLLIVDVSVGLPIFHVDLQGVNPSSMKEYDPETETKTEISELEAREVITNLLGTFSPSEEVITKLANKLVEASKSGQLTESFVNNVIAEVPTLTKIDEEYESDQLILSVDNSNNSTKFITFANMLNSIRSTLPDKMSNELDTEGKYRIKVLEIGTESRFLVTLSDGTKGIFLVSNSTMKLADLSESAPTVNEFEALQDPKVMQSIEALKTTPSQWGESLYDDYFAPRLGSGNLQMLLNYFTNGDLKFFSNLRALEQSDPRIADNIKKVMFETLNMIFDDLSGEAMMNESLEESLQPLIDLISQIIPPMFKC